MARILYLHGRESSPNAGKANRLRDAGHTVFGPQLDDSNDLSASVGTAEAALQDARASGGVDLIVASSRGGAVAVAMNAAHVPRLLLCPAWKLFRGEGKVAGPVRILHAEADAIVPLADSVALLAQNGLDAGLLTVVGDDHRLHDEAATTAMLRAVEEMSRTGR